MALPAEPHSGPDSANHPDHIDFKFKSEMESLPIPPLNPEFFSSDNCMASAAVTSDEFMSDLGFGFGSDDNCDFELAFDDWDKLYLPSVTKDFLLPDGLDPGAAESNSGSPESGSSAIMVSGDDKGGLDVSRFLNCPASSNECSENFWWACVVSGPWIYIEEAPRQIGRKAGADFAGEQEVHAKGKVAYSGSFFCSSGGSMNGFAGSSVLAVQMKSEISDHSTDDHLDHISLKERQKMLQSRKLFGFEKALIEDIPGPLSKDLMQQLACKGQADTSSAGGEALVATKSLHDNSGRNSSVVCRTSMISSPHNVIVEAVSTTYQIFS